VSPCAALVVAAPLALAGLLTSSCAEPATSVAQASPQAAPDAPPAQVRLFEVTPAPLVAGRFALFGVEVSGGEGGFVGGVRATLGSRDGIVLRYDDDGRDLRVLAPVHIDEERAQLTLRVEGELSGGATVVSSKPLAITAGDYPSSEIRVSRRFMEPSRKQRARAKRDKARMKRALGSSGSARLWAGSFARPVDTQPTSPFGTARLLNGKKERRHLGWDLDGRTGDPIHATARGRVALAADHFYSGKTIVLDHGQRLFSLYLHMSAFEVDVGDVVEQGALIGRVGRTGRVTGPHLHFAVKVSGAYVDPEQLLKLDLSGDPRALDQSIKDSTRSQNASASRKSSSTSPNATMSPGDSR
jgi:hypothetical protein